MNGWVGARHRPCGRRGSRCQYQRKVSSGVSKREIVNARGVLKMKGGGRETRGWRGGSKIRSRKIGCPAF
jgi:hypothetical protein